MTGKNLYFLRQREKKKVKVPILILLSNAEQVFVFSFIFGKDFKAGVSNLFYNHIVQHWIKLF